MRRWIQHTSCWYDGWIFDKDTGYRVLYVYCLSKQQLFSWYSFLLLTKDYCSCHRWHIHSRVKWFCCRTQMRISLNILHIEYKSSSDCLCRMGHVSCNWWLCFRENQTDQILELWYKWLNQYLQHRGSCLVLSR